MGSGHHSAPAHDPRRAVGGGGGGGSRGGRVGGGAAWGGDSDWDDGPLSGSSGRGGASTPVVGSLPWRLGRFCVVTRELESETGQERACHLLAALAIRRKDLLPAIGAARGVEAVLEALCDYVTTARVVERALGALKAFTAIDVLREAVVSLFGSEVVIAAMAAHARSTRIQDQGVTVLANAAFGSNVRKRRIGRAGGIEAILTAMRAHARYDGTAARCCLALRNLTYRSQVNQYLSGRAGGVAAILDAMRRFPHSAQLQYQAIVALSNMSADDKGNRAAIVGGGGGRDSRHGRGPGRRRRRRRRAGVGGTGSTAASTRRLPSGPARSPVPGTGRSGREPGTRSVPSGNRNRTVPVPSLPLPYVNGSYQTVTVGPDVVAVGSGFGGWGGRPGRVGSVRFRFPDQPVGRAGPTLPGREPVPPSDRPVVARPLPVRPVPFGTYRLPVSRSRNRTGRSPSVGRPYVGRARSRFRYDYLSGSGSGTLTVYRLG
eukprot:TRINITY_DN8072_c0_g1_i1.p1 TRINITY_DN8072_c0_g1~~TRINITY_DN8072_c0_g1_i1.p1  ORF type:complete len:489 (-),score=13.07 TRINITY_DN8072_c0_g1_i1:73-1539(-)